jgi:hypothetical protein
MFGVPGIWPSLLASTRHTPKCTMDLPTKPGKPLGSLDSLPKQTKEKCSHSPSCLQTHTTQVTTRETRTNRLSSLSYTDTRLPAKHNDLRYYGESCGGEYEKVEAEADPSFDWSGIASPFTYSESDDRVAAAARTLHACLLGHTQTIGMINQEVMLSNLKESLALCRKYVVHDDSLAHRHT